jgi:hypothetical protein
MPIVLLDVGADEILKTYFNNTRPVGGNNLTLRLFATNVTPSQSGVTYVEATGGGYAAIALTNGSWVVNPTDDPSVATYAQQTFTFTGPLTTNPNIYGYYITDADGVIIYAEAVAYFTPLASGDAVKVTPKFQLSSGTPV